MKFSGRENQVNPFMAMMAYCRCWEKVRFVPAAVLLLAAGLKTHQLATVPALGEGLLHNRWFNTFVVEFELLFAVWLIAGRLPKCTRIISAALFSAFAVVSSYKAISGEISCGCFGSVAVNPWFTALFDCGMAAWCMFSRTGTFTPAHLQPKKLFAFLGIWGVLALLTISVTMTGDFNFGSSANGLEKTERNGKQYIRVAPAKWIGKSFPLLPYIATNENDVTQEDFQNGVWTFVLYHSGCRNCQNKISELQNTNTLNLVCVEVPPLSGQVIEGCINTHLDRNVKWFVYLSAFEHWY